MRKVAFANEEYYHIFNRGTDKREIFSDKFDANRFIKSMKYFNTITPVGSIFNIERSENNNSSNRTTTIEDDDKLVDIIAYCLNPNHYHFILKQLVKGGISEFMKRLGGGYTRYYNEKYKRNGVLFQGKFKAVHIETNEQLLHDSVYVNLNNKVHKKFDGFKKNILDSISNRSSWGEYVSEEKINNLCKKDIILGQFRKINEYKRFAQNTIKSIREKRYNFD